MSSAAQPDPSTTAQIIAGLSQALPIVETIVAAAFPGAGTIAAAALKVAQGVAAGVPQAIALYEQFQTATPPTTEELTAYAADENGAYAQLMADIDARLAAT